MPGPPKTPRGFKIVAGTDRPSRADPPEMPQFEPVRAFPAAPQHLNTDGVEMWRSLGDQLVSCGVLQVVDLWELEHLCVAWQQFRKKARADMEVTASENNALTSLLSQFGLTPAARRRVVQNLTQAPKGNRFAGHGKRPAA